MTTKVHSTSLNAVSRAKRKLRRTLVLVALLIGALLTTISYLTYRRMIRESSLQQQLMSAQLFESIESAFMDRIEIEELRPFDHYSFFTVATSEITNEQAFQRSPLASLDIQNSPQGLVGYFQIDANGAITSPILPHENGATSRLFDGAETERGRREETLSRIRSILLRIQTADGSAHEALDSSQGALPGAGASAEPETQKSLSQDLLLDPERAKTKGQGSQPALEELGGSSAFPHQQERNRSGAQIGSVDDTARKSVGARKEFSNALVYPYESSESSGYLGIFSDSPSREAAPAAYTPPRPSAVGRPNKPSVVSLEAEVDPLQARLVDGEYLLLFRKAWRGGQRFIQGVILRQKDFVEGVLREQVSRTVMPASTSIVFWSEESPLLEFTYSASTRSSYGSRKIDLPTVDSAQHTTAATTLLYQATLTTPLDLYTASISAQRIPLPAGALLLAFMTVILCVVILFGLLSLHRLGLQHIVLAQKRVDFVSAVSHELKTPLTSIRMYSEMLKNDWVQDEEKRRGYYGFIFQESERLSRLINNVLQLSRISTTNDIPTLERRSTPDCLRLVQSKIENVVASAGFTLTVSAPNDGEHAAILVDDDALVQITINLVENAVKFSRLAERKEVQIGFEPEFKAHSVTLVVRDFGPGVPRSERRKIFELFYRREDEMTRQVSGTGIGLALVKELARRMSATVDYRSKEPGSEFRVIFPVARD